MKSDETPPDPAPDRSLSSKRVRFGEFTLDLSGRSLRRHGRRLRLTPKPFAVLAYLVENRHETIKKQQLLDVVWKDAAVTEGALVQAIREIRRVLEDDDREPRYIETIPRAGYRFIGSIVPDTEEPAGSILTAPNDRDPRAWSWPVVAAAVGVIAMAFAGLWMAYDVDPRPAEAAVPAARSIRQLTSEPLNALKPTYSPDGKRLLYVSPGPGVPGILDLFVMPAGGGTPWQLTKGINASGDQPVFTPDGARVVFSRYRSGEDGTRLPDLWSVPSFGGTPSVLLTEASGAGFSPDGRHMAYTKHAGGEKPLWEGPVDDAARHKAIAERGFTPRWSPDGRWIAFTTSDPEGGSGHLWIVSVTGAEPRRLTEEPEDIFGLTWTPDSQSVVVASNRAGQGMQLRMLPMSGGAAVPLTAGVGYYVSPSMSRDGTLAFSFYSPSSGLALCAHLTDRECKRVVRGEFNFGHLWPRLSPSGRRVASVGRLHEGTERLQVFDVETGNRIRMSERSASHPAWLDDDRVAYLSREANQDDTAIHVMSVASGVSSKVASIEGEAIGLAPHPAGKRFGLISRGRNGVQRIVVLALETGRERVLASGGSYEELRWRPDGSALAWSGPSSGADKASNGIWILDDGASSPRQPVKDGYAPVWSEDGAAIYFVRVRGGASDMGLWRFDLLTGETARVRDWGRVPYYDLVGGRVVFAVDDAVAQVFEMRLPANTAASRP